MKQITNKEIIAAPPPCVLLKRLNMEHSCVILFSQTPLAGNSLVQNNDTVSRHFVSVKRGNKLFISAVLT